MLTSKKGMSALQLGRYMGFGSVKTARLMGHKIRTALIEPEMISLAALSKSMRRSSAARLRTGIGISATASPAAPASGKTIVGAVRRKGNVVARVIENVSADP